MQWFGKNVKDDEQGDLPPNPAVQGYRTLRQPLLGMAVVRELQRNGDHDPTGFPIQAESLSEFRAYLMKRRVNMIVIHEANYRSPKLLADYFTYNEREGLTQSRDLEGWQLVYSYPWKPTKFLIYRVDMTSPSAARLVAGDDETEAHPLAP